MTLPSDADLNATIARAFGTKSPSQPVGTTMILPTVAPASAERPMKIKRPCAFCLKVGGPCSLHGGPKRHRGVPMTTEERGRRSAATRIGVSYEEYAGRLAKFERWCSQHRAWHAVKEFSPDPSRPSGVAASCRAAKNAFKRQHQGRWKRKPHVADPSTCVVCAKMRGKYGTACQRHGGPGHGTAWQQRKRAREMAQRPAK